MTEENRLLGDRYELSDTLGRGGMAEVDEGRDLRLGRRVAVKILRPELARDPSFQARFRREAQSAASLNHPNIVAVYDTGEDMLEGGPTEVLVPYIVMEYVDGMTLRQLLQSGRRLLPERALEIAAGVLAALDYSHRHGIVHRDIKPANVMLTRTGDVKVMDFGIARALADSATSMTATATVMGTAQYLSPEQARGEVVDARSDLYSAGCLLYELLTGRPPFTGDSPVSVAYQHVSENPEPPSAVDASVDPAIDAIVLKSLAKHPDDRYQSAAEMRADIERVLAGGPATAGIPVMAPDATVRMAAVAGAGAQRITSSPEDNGGRPRSNWIWLGVIILIMAVAAAMLFLGKALFGPGTSQQVQVPMLTGQTITQAAASLQQVGLVLGQETTQVSTQTKGTVIDQSPKPGETLQRGQAVAVVVSAGPQQVPVPTLTGLTSVSAAQAALTQAGLQLGTVTQQDSAQPENYVLAQSVAPGTMVNAGTSVNITVSTALIVVPDETGKSEAQARSDLVNAGFQVNTVTQSSNGPSGIVLAQTPSGGTKAKKGTLVTLTISVPAPSQSPSTSTSPSPSPSGSVSTTPPA